MFTVSWISERVYCFLYSSLLFPHVRLGLLRGLFSSDFPSELFKDIRSKHFIISYFFIRSRIITSPPNPRKKTAHYRCLLLLMKRILCHPSSYREGRLPIVTRGSRQPLHVMVLYTLLVNQKHNTLHACLQMLHFLMLQRTSEKTPCNCGSGRSRCCPWH
jgi:hypothetical protein